MNKTNLPYQIEISARHVHLSAADLATLFGPDAQLNNVQNLSVHGEFKSDKTVTIIGSKRNLERVAVLGPVRKQTQVEIALTDCYTLGVKNVPVRLSGDLVGSAPVTLQGPNGTLTLAEGMIIAQPHLHINQADMEKYGLHVGETLDIKAGQIRPVTFHQVVVRPAMVDYPIVHLDTDEGNACR